MVLGIQILGVFFGLLMLYVTFLHQKRKEFTVKEYGFWVFFWIVFILISLFPNWLDFIVVSLSLSRTMDLFIILGFMFLIAAVFYTYLTVRNTQKKLEEIVRKIAFRTKKK